MVMHQYSAVLQVSAHLHDDREKLLRLCRR